MQKAVTLFLLVFISASVQAGTIAYWQFEQGSFLDDSSGNGHSLTNTGVTNSTDAALGSGSASFNGAQTAFNTTSTLNLSGSSDLTIEWFMKTTLTSLAVMFEHGSGVDTESFGSAINDSFASPNKIEAYQRTAGTTAYIEKTSDDVVQDGGWHHVAMTIAGSEIGTDRIGLFVDGIDVGEYVPNGSPTGTPGFLNDFLYIGSRLNSDLKFSGLIDELRISDGLLTPGSFLNASMTPVPAPAALWLFGTTLLGFGLRFSFRNPSERRSR